MASGKTHEWVTLLMLPPVFWIGWQYFHLNTLFVSLLTTGVWVGGFLLSPDLDIKSRPFYRWGIFRFIWWPYQRLIRHRSSFSHGVGFAAWFRLLYVVILGSLVYMGALWGLGILQKNNATVSLFRASHQTWRDIFYFVNKYLNELMCFGGGVWLGSVLHVALDGLSSLLKKR